MLLSHAKSIAHTHTRARGVICAKRKRTKKKMGSIQKYRSFWLYSGRLDSLPSLRLVVTPHPFLIGCKNSPNPLPLCCVDEAIFENSVFQHHTSGDSRAYFFHYQRNYHFVSIFPLICWKDLSQMKDNLLCYYSK